MLLWDTHWQGSVFALNLFKCVAAAVLFAVAAVYSAGGLHALLATLSHDSLVALCTSSLVGVVIGDSTWLLAMKILGTRRVLLMDSMKPFLASAAGGWFFSEAMSLTSMLAMCCTVVGVLVVSLEQEDCQAGREMGRSRYLWGCFLAAFTTLCDVAGATLTKGFGPTLGPWTVGCVRFGFAASCLGCTAAASRIVSMTPHGLRLTPAEGEEDAKAADASLPTIRSGDEKAQWHEMPEHSPKTWRRIVAGTIFVTFLCPALSYTALFKIPFSLWLTLDSLGPVFAIPLAWLVRRERASPRAMLGSVLAVAGVVIFCSSVAL